MIQRMNINRIIGPIFLACLTLICLYFSKVSLIFMGIIPMAIAISYFDEGFISLIISLGLVFFLGTSFIDLKALKESFLPLLIVGLGLIGIISLVGPSKRQIFLVFALVTLVFSFAFKYQMVENGLSIEVLATRLKEMTEERFAYSYPVEIYKLLAASYPSIIGALGLIYGILSVKLIRNYLSFKDSPIEDTGSLNRIRISIKDLFVLAVIYVLIYFVLDFLGVDRDYILINLIFLALILFIANGLSLFDYTLAKSKLPLSRAFQWFFMLILFQVLVIPILLFGILDVFVDFRLRRINAKQ